MARLTNWDRDSIISAAVKAAFKAREDAHAVEANALACEAYDFLFLPTERKALLKVPSKWLLMDDEVRLNVGGQTIYLKMTEARAIPSGSRYSTIGAIPHGDLCERIQAHALAGEKLKESRQEAKAKTKALVYSVNTLAQLQDIWPDGAEFYAFLLSKDTKPAIPALRVEEVNKALGLPLAA